MYSVARISALRVYIYIHITMRPGDVYLYYSRGEKKPTFFGLNNYPVVNGWRKDDKRSFRFSYSVLNGEPRSY